MHIDLSGQRVLVTGTGRGIGRAIAEHLLDAGARVVLHYNRSADQAKEISERYKGNAVALQADLSSTTETALLHARSVEALGGLDALVNNAGLAPATSLDMSVEKWEHAWDLTIAVNLKAPALLSRLAVRHFAAHGGGRIVMIASRAAFRGDSADYMAYASSKGGMVSFTRSIARAFGKDGVKAFVLAPGFTRTDMAQRSIDRYGEEFVTRDIALERLTEPKDVAPLATLLVSGLADHATGCTIDINAASYVH